MRQIAFCGDQILAQVNDGCAHRPPDSIGLSPINYAENTVNVRRLALDEFNLPRVDVIKLDVEGMELEALEGAHRTIEKSRPILLIEKIKTNAEQLGRWLSERRYTLREAGINIIAIHSYDKALGELDSPGRLK